MIEKPKFWRWAILTVDSNNFLEVQQSQRVNIVPEIIISSDNPDGSHIPSSSMLAILGNLFAAVVDGSSHLKSLKLMCSEDLWALDPELLSQALIRLEEFNFCSYSTFNPFSTTQLVSLLTAIDQTNDLKLKVLKIPNENNDFSGVPTEVRVAAIVKLKETNIPSGSVAQRLFTKIAESPVVNMKKIDPSRTDMFNSIPPDLFAEALVRIETVDKITGSFIHRLACREQVESLLRKIASTEILTLQRLSLSRVDLAHISPLVVSQAVVKLKTLSVKLSLDGLAGAFFQGIGDCLDLRLSRLGVKEEDLSSVESRVLVGAITRLEKVSLYKCLLTTTQLTDFFSTISVSEDHSLKFLRLRYINLRSVPPELLVTALMSGLKEVDFKLTKLTAVQLTGIYTMVADRKPRSLRRINLEGNDHRSIPADLRQRARLNKSVVII